MGIFNGWWFELAYENGEGGGAASGAGAGASGASGAASGAGAGGNGVVPPNDEDPLKKLKFTAEQQEFFNKKIKEEKEREQKKAQQQNDKTISELRKLQEQAGVTQTQKDDLEKRIKDLQTQYMSKEELAKQEQEKKEKEYQDQLKSQRGEAEKWKNLFHESTIVRAIQDGAINAEAYNPEQIIDILVPKTKLVEEMDEENKPTGRFVPRVKMIETDNDGKPVALDLTVKEVLSKMKNSPDKFGNLFKSGVAGGLGQSGSAAGAGGRKKNPARMSTGEYLEARKKDPTLNFTSDAKK